MEGNEENDLDRFPLDEPWNPISYFAEAEEHDLLEHHLPSPPDAKLAELFGTNVEAIEKDLEKIESMKNTDNEQSTELIYGEDNDEDTLEKFVTYEDAEDHLKAVDNSFIISQKSIFGDLEKLRRFRQHSLDNDDVTEAHHRNDNGDFVQDFNNGPNLQDIQESEVIEDLLKTLPDVSDEDLGMNVIQNGPEMFYEQNIEGANNATECNGLPGSLDSTGSVEEVLKTADAIVNAVTSRDLENWRKETSQFELVESTENIDSRPDSDGIHDELIPNGKAEPKKLDSVAIPHNQVVPSTDTGLPTQNATNESINSNEVMLDTCPASNNSSVIKAPNRSDISLHDELLSVSPGYRFGEPDFQGPASVDKDLVMDNLEAASEGAVSQPELLSSGIGHEWSCPKCTFINEASDRFCEICNEHNPLLQDHTAVNEKFVEPIEPIDAVGWTCSRCTFINNNNINTCELCNAYRSAVGDENTASFSVATAEQVDEPKRIEEQDINTTERLQLNESEDMGPTGESESSDTVQASVDLAEICRQVSEQHADSVLSSANHQHSDNEHDTDRLHESNSGIISEIPQQEHVVSTSEVSSERPRTNTNLTNDSEDLEQFINEQMRDTPASDQLRTNNEDQPLPTQTEAESQLGWFAPKWVPDKDAKVCMLCETRFTVVKRRHHCRACGKVLCANCCNMKFNLPYLNYKPARVCQSCCDILLRVICGPELCKRDGKMKRAHHSLPLSATDQSISESEDIPGREQSVSLAGSEATATSSSPSSSFSSPSGGRGSPPPDYALAAASSRGRGTSGVGTPTLPGYYTSTRGGSSRGRTDSERSAVIMYNSSQTNLPPIIRVQNESLKIINNPDLSGLFQQMHDPDANPVVFLVNKNLVVKLKVVIMDCCVNKKCWCFVSDGMGASNQEEIVILLEYEGDVVPSLKSVLQQLNAIFEKAKHGEPVSDLGYITFDNFTLMDTRPSGMIFVKNTCQCIKKIPIPASPHLFGIYVKNSEIPWAKNFPLRLLLRLGYENKCYPYPLYNTSEREPVYGPVGRTIMNLLADFRNYQYGVPRIVGVAINFTENEIKVRLPQSRYDEVLKTVNTAEENVLTFAGNFSSRVDGHLVCTENEGSYKTQVFLKEELGGKVTGVSFIVFSAALKPSSSGEGQQAKTSIVEDGIMAQMTADVMKKIRSSIKDMQDYTVQYGDPSEEVSKKLSITWGTSEGFDGQRPVSPIDGTPFENLTNMKIRHSYDFTTNTSPAKIHWMEVYFLPGDADTVNRLSARELSQMTSSVAKACMGALSPHLCTLVELGNTNIGLRINLEPDKVEYKIGSNQELLPDYLSADLDDKLIPAMHGVLTSLPHRKVSAELLFQITHIV